MKKILIVDDEEQVGKTLRRLLRREGFEVAVETDAISALVTAEQFRPDLLITDYRMPRMNGAELIREINLRFPRIKCIVMSGYVGEVDADPICEFVSKPFDTASLVAQIRAALAPLILAVA